MRGDPRLARHAPSVRNFLGGPSPFARSDRSRFLSKLDELVHAARRDVGVRRAGWPNSPTTWRDGRDDPGIVPGLGDGSARCLEADAQEDFLEGFSLSGADHSRARQILNFLSTSLDHLPLSGNRRAGRSAPPISEAARNSGVTHGKPPFVP